MSRKNRPLLITCLDSNSNNESVETVAARRITTIGCRLRKGVTVDILAERNGDSFSLAAVFCSEDSAVENRRVDFEDGFALGNLPPVTLATQALIDMTGVDSDTALSDLICAAVSKYCKLTIERMAGGRGQFGRIDCARIDIEARGYSSSGEGLFADLENFLKFVKTPSDDDD